MDGHSTSRIAKGSCLGLQHAGPVRGLVPDVFHDVNQGSDHRRGSVSLDPGGVVAIYLFLKDVVPLDQLLVGIGNVDRVEERLDDGLAGM